MIFSFSYILKITMPWYNVLLFLLQGAIASIFVGLVMGIWLGFGNPKIPVTNLPLSVSGCMSNTTRVAAAPLIAEALPLTG